MERFTEKGMQRKGTFQWGSLNLISIATSDPGADLDPLALATVAYPTIRFVVSIGQF